MSSIPVLQSYVDRIAFLGEKLRVELDLRKTMERNMEKIGGMFVVGAIEQISLMRSREKFAKQYCTERGWDVDNLDMIKVLEIRKQDGWKTPSGRRSNEGRQ